MLYLTTCSCPSIFLLCRFMKDIPFYQILDFKEVFTDTILSKQVQLTRETCIRPLSYFNTLPSGDLVSDQEFDTFLCDQMFEEEFEFTVADDMSIGKTTLRNSIGKSQAFNLNSMKLEKDLFPTGKGFMKKLNTFHLGDKNVIPCEPIDDFSNEDFVKSSNLSSNRHLLPENSINNFHSLREIKNEYPSPRNDLDSPVCQDHRGVNELRMPNETPNFGLFLRATNPTRMVPTDDQNYVIEELQEEDLAGCSNKSYKDPSSKVSSHLRSSPDQSRENSKSKSKEKESKQSSRKDNSTEIKKRLVELSAVSQSERNVKLSKSSIEPSQGINSTKGALQTVLSSSKIASDTQAPDSKKEGITFLDLEKDRLPIQEGLIRKGTVSESSNAKNVSSIKQDQLFNMMSEADNNSLFMEKTSPDLLDLSRNHSIGALMMHHNILQQFEPQLSANNSALIPLAGSGLCMEKSLSEIDQKILAVKLKTQMIDLAHKKAKIDMGLPLIAENIESPSLCLNPAQEYLQIDSLPSTVKNVTPHKITGKLADSNPFFQSLSKLAANNENQSSPDDPTPSFHLNRKLSKNQPQHQDSDECQKANDFTEALRDIEKKEAYSTKINSLVKGWHEKTKKSSFNPTEIRPSTLTSPQKNRLKKLVGLKKQRDYKISKEPKEDGFSHMSPSISRSSVRHSKVGSILGLSKDNLELYTSREGQSPLMQPEIKERMSAHTFYTVMHNTLVPIRKTVFSFTSAAANKQRTSAVKSPKKRQSVLDTSSKNPFKATTAEFKSGSLKDCVASRFKTKTGTKTREPTSTLIHRSMKTGVTTQGSHQSIIQKQAVSPKNASGLPDRPSNARDQLNVKDLKKKLASILGSHAK